MTATPPAALDALAAWLLADTLVDTGGPNYEPLRVPPSTKRLEIEAALAALRTQVETLTAGRDQWREAHTREYEARIATEVEQSAAVSARATAEAALAVARECCAKLVEESIARYPKQLDARMALAIAAKTIRRGRHLTAEEGLANLKKAMDEAALEPRT